VEEGIGGATGDDVGKEEFGLRRGQEPRLDSISDGGRLRGSSRIGRTRLGRGRRESQAGLSLTEYRPKRRQHPVA